MFEKNFLTKLSALLLAAAIPAAHAGAGPDPQACQQRSNNTPDQLLECIQGSALWNHLVDFQQIADQHPDASGHGNRDTGTSGYKASVDYVAGLMQQAGYSTQIQSYTYRALAVTGEPELTIGNHRYAWNREWFVARLSAGGALSAPLQPASGSGTGCRADEFVGFTPGHIALLQRGACSYDVQAANAAAAGAAAVILYNHDGDAARTSHSRGPDDGRAFQVRLTRAASLPVIGALDHPTGSDLRQRSLAGDAPVARIDIRTQLKTGTDYNLIAESPYGDPNKTVVVDAHLDSIFGAGILDNASGSSTILEVALNMAKTPTRNRLRYVWFGGEELGLLGSHYYTRNLSSAELQKIAFDIDVDVTATPNYDYLVADPGQAGNVKRFPANVVPDSQIGNQFFADYFTSIGVPSQAAWFGNDGTDSNSFALVGVPDTGILTQQDCCKQAWEVSIWGGTPGDYEGRIPGYWGGCVDRANRWCDDLANNDPAVMEIASKAAAYTIWQLANHPFSARGR